MPFALLLTLFGTLASAQTPNVPAVAAGAEPTPGGQVAAPAATGAEPVAQPAGEESDEAGELEPADGSTHAPADLPDHSALAVDGGAASAASKDASDKEASDEEEDEGPGTAPADELAAAKAAEAQALADDARRDLERVEIGHRLGPGHPLSSRLTDLPDALPQADADARESRQIARELEQFETFDASAAASHYDIPVELNDQVSQYIRMFQGPLRDHFTTWLERGARYVPRMREILASEGVPEDTVFLSLIESGFSTLAYSVARAAGQWQFIAPTGRRFGLRSDFWVDERRDPEKATVAAARYLRELRGQLGSWYLAWAGYNAGAGTISKAIRKAHSNDFWTLMRGRVLRRETKGYVPKLIAAALISKHPHAFGFEDLQWEELPASDQVPVPDPTELSFLASAAGTDVETLRALNPALRRFCTPPAQGGQPYAIRVPAGSAERVLAALKARPSADRLRLRYHKVQPGEGLGAVAHRFGVSPESIARLNGLHHQAIKPGRELVIALAPGAGGSGQAVGNAADAEALGAGSGEGAAGPVCDERVAKVTDEREREIERRRGRRRRWRRGTNGWRASDDCQDPFAVVAASAGADRPVLDAEPAAPAPTRRGRTAGAALAVSAVDPAIATPPATPATAAPLPSGASHYRVAEGDSLWSIALAHGLSLEDLCAWNHIAQPKHARIFPGQELWVRGTALATPSAPWRAATSAQAQASAEPVSPPAAPGGTYTLRDGDNLWQVAKRLHLKASDLLRWNNLDEDSVLQPGQVIKLGE